VENGSKVWYNYVNVNLICGYFSLISRFDPKIINEWNNRKKNAIEKEGYERFESIVSFPNFLLIVNESMYYTNTEDDTNSDSLDDKKFIKTLEKHWKIENDNKQLASENSKNFIFNLLKFRFFFDTKIIKREFAKNYTEDGKWSLQYLEMYYDGNKNSRKPSYKQVFIDNDRRMKLLQSALRITYTSPKSMHWISLALSSIDDNKTNEELIAILEEYCCKKIKIANYEIATGFGIDRIVFTFLDYLLLRDMDKSNRSADFKTKFSNYEYQYRTSIEHFYPQNPVGGNESWKGKSELNNFGNLALITVKANSKFSNSVPVAKIANDNQGIILQSPKLYLMQESMVNNVWDEKLVLTNEKEMIGILKTELNNHNL